MSSPTLTSNNLTLSFPACVYTFKSSGTRIGRERSGPVERCLARELLEAAACEGREDRVLRGGGGGDLPHRGRRTRRRHRQAAHHPGGRGLVGPPQGGDDAFLFKFKSNGTTLWGRQFGDAGDDIAYGLAVGQHDRTFTVGLNYYQNWFGASNNAFIAIHDANGQMTPW